MAGKESSKSKIKKEKGSDTQELYQDKTRKKEHDTQEIEKDSYVESRIVNKNQFDNLKTEGKLMTNDEIIEKIQNKIKEQNDVIKEQQKQIREQEIKMNEQDQMIQNLENEVANLKNSAKEREDLIGRLSDLIE